MAFARRQAAPANRRRPIPRLDTLLAKQGEIGGQFTQTVAAQEALTRTLAERLEALDKRLGENLTDNATKTAATIAGIGERLTVIDEAQKNISALSGQVVSLQQILSNKQARGAFGQAQMEEIVRDGLPTTLYDFQFTLSNRNRPDCVIRIPGNKALLVIDSKFPLEASSRCAAPPPTRKESGAGAGARRRVQACQRHCRKISDPRRGPDAGDHVRAVGIHLCRTARRLSRT